MNYLAINCSVVKGFGRVTVVILDSENNVFRYVFKSPSVFSFTNNSAEILNWHRDNIVSLFSQFDIEGVVIKKTEQGGFGRLRKSDIFKLYLEGVMLSLAGSIGKFNKHYYKANIQRILANQNVFDLSLDVICVNYELSNYLGTIANNEVDVTKDALLASISLRKVLQK